MKARRRLLMVIWLLLPMCRAGGKHSNLRHPLRHPCAQRSKQSELQLSLKSKYGFVNNPCSTQPHMILTLTWALLHSLSERSRLSMRDGRLILSRSSNLVCAYRRSLVLLSCDDVIKRFMSVLVRILHTVLHPKMWQILRVKELALWSCTLYNGQMFVNVCNKVRIYHVVGLGLRFDCSHFNFSIGSTVYLPCCPARSTAYIYFFTIAIALCARIGQASPRSPSLINARLFTSVRMILSVVG